jgi:sugar lactone lactonase YvrE
MKRWLQAALCLAALLLGLGSIAQATTLIATVAGGGSSGPPDGPPLSIGLEGPSDLAFDGAGRLVVMSSGSGAGGVACWVARLAADGSLVNRVAGDGSCSLGGPNFGGDGGPATSAKISGDTTYNAYPGLTVDAAGNVYIADHSNHRVRKVDAATGLISTVAGNGTNGFSGDGGAATAAQLSYPARVAVDAAGNLYIASGARIRKVAAATGVISTVAGSTLGFGGDGGPATAAALGPMGMALSVTGDLYIADMWNSRIRKVAAATGTISTVAGIGAGYSGDGGLATAAQLDSPTGVALDAAGNLFIADYNNNRIRKVDAATGIISTVAGNGTAGFGGDGGAATAAQLTWPTGVTVDAAGNIYIADNQNNRVRKVDAATGIISTLMGTGGPATLYQNTPAAQAAFYSQGLVLAGDQVFFTDSMRNFVNRLTLSTGLVTTVAGVGTWVSGGDGGPAASAQFSVPNGLARDAQGNLYVAEDYGHRVRKLDAATGLVSTVAGTGVAGYGGDGGAATAAQLNHPKGLALDVAGNLYIADDQNNRIRKVDAATGRISTVAGIGYGHSGDGGLATAANLAYPRGLAFDASGNLHIVEGEHIRKVDATTGVISTVAGGGSGSAFSGDGGSATAARLFYPQGIAFDSAGNLFIADYGNNRIRKVDAATGVISTVAGTGTAGFAGDGGPPTAAQLNLPTALAFDANGMLYVAGGSRLRRLADTPDAPSAVVATAGNAQATVGFAAPAAGSLPISGYTVVSNPAGGVDAQAGTTALSHTLTGLTNGTSYTFTVVATNAIGDGPVSAASNAVTPATLPGAPTGASATAGNARATVGFSAPVSNGGSAITGYTVISNPAGGVDADAGSTALNHTVTGLTNGVSYTFSVVATNGVGNGPTSVASNTVVPGAVAGGGGKRAVLGVGSWVVDAAQTAGFIPTTGHAKSPPNLPVGYSFPHGLLDFTLTGGTPGSSATLVLTFPSPLPPGTVYWKYGPSPAGHDCAGVACSTPHWYRMPPSQAVVSGNTVTLTITDGGVGDDDLTANGSIVDAGGPGVSDVSGVPTLSEWALWLLAGLMGWVAFAWWPAAGCKKIADCA